MSIWSFKRTYDYFVNLGTNGCLRDKHVRVWTVDSIQTFLHSLFHFPFVVGNLRYTTFCSFFIFFMFGFTTGFLCFPAITQFIFLFLLPLLLLNFFYIHHRIDCNGIRYPRLEKKKKKKGAGFVVFSFFSDEGRKKKSIRVSEILSVGFRRYVYATFICFDLTWLWTTNIWLFWNSMLHGRGRFLPFGFAQC